MNPGAKSDENRDDDFQDVIAEIKRQEQLRKEKQYKSWCDRYASFSENYNRELKDGYVAEVELQPYRWIQHGLDLIGSRKAFGTIQLSNGQEGADLQAHLPYTVFQMGAEIFLKGMWLYKHEECRKLKSDSYIAKNRRNYFLDELKNLSRNHDLVEIIKHLESIAIYRRDTQTSRFLKIVSGISKEFYFPMGNSKTRWADERYPKRFYNDLQKSASADQLKSYPEHWPISKLFSETAERIDFLWGNH